MLGNRGAKAAIVGILLLLLAVIIACGEEATATPEPDATAAPAPAPAATVAAQPAAPDAPAATVAAAPAAPAATPTAAPAAAPAPEPTAAMMDEKKPEGTFNVGMSGLGPYVATLYDAGYFKNRFAELVTHETLFIMDYEGEWAPRLIKSFDISPDGLTYTMYLQEGAKWHAGASAAGDWGEFNADDFIWSIGEIAREGSNHVQSGNTRRVFECDGCTLTKIDDYTVELTRPEPTFELTWYSQAPIPGFSMNSKRHYEAVGQDVALLEDVGTAPWEMVEHITDDRRINEGCGRPLAPCARLCRDGLARHAGGVHPLVQLPVRQFGHRHLQLGLHPSHEGHPRRGPELHGLSWGHRPDALVRWWATTPPTPHTIILTPMATYG